MPVENVASLADVSRLSRRIEDDVANGVISLSVPISRKGDERIDRLKTNIDAANQRVVQTADESE